MKVMKVEAKLDLDDDLVATVRPRRGVVLICCQCGYRMGNADYGYVVGGYEALYVCKECGDKHLKEIHDYDFEKES